MSGQQSTDLSGTAIIVMGVCGAGKTSLAGKLSETLGFPMVEADDFHSDSNRAKMAKGIGLTDEDRMPWLAAVTSAAREKTANANGVIIACSALRKVYRDVFRAGFNDCMFIHLTGSREILAERLTHRTGHFVDAGLLDSQLKTLEPPDRDERYLEIDVSLPPEKAVEEALDGVRAQSINA
ncbi:MAG: gluconokinase [Roseibium sp.]